MRAGEKFLEHVKTWDLTLTTHSRSCFFEVLIVQCQNSIKYILLRSLSAAMLTWPCKTNFTSVPDPQELQILLEDQTAKELLFQSYAAITRIDRMTCLACISHYVRGHVHKTGHNYNGRKQHTVQKDSRGVRVLGTSFRLGPTLPTSQILENIQYGGSSVVKTDSQRSRFIAREAWFTVLLTKFAFIVTFAEFLDLYSKQSF